MIAVPFFIALYMMGMALPAVILFILASLTDMLDGQIARKHNLVTNFGKIMDPLADKILVYSAFCMMVEDGTVPGWMMIVILAREFVVSGMRTVAASEGIVVAAGMSGKIKTVLQMICMLTCLLEGLIPALTSIDTHMILSYITTAAMTFMTLWSGLDYFKAFLPYLDPEK